MKKKDLKLYIHIPFCVKKCAYCDFLSSPQNQRVIDDYVDALIREIQAYQGWAKSYFVRSIFVGGGTPSVLQAEQMERIFVAIHDTFGVAENAEVTVEANPGTVTREKLEVYKKCGINRISFGLQSTNNEELKLLGRIHTYEEFLESFQMARETGFDNINVDLISAIPKQTLESWENSLVKVASLNPEHISAYSLIVEEGTPFAKLYGEGAPLEKDLPDEDTERAIYYQTEESLEAAGYRRYEISNYAKEGKECRHNLGYWERKEYLGLGLGAASLVGNIRFSNTTDLQKYLEYSNRTKDIQEQKEVLSETAQMEEFLFLGLRKTAGIDVKEFEDTFGQSVDEFCGRKVEELSAKGLLEKEGKMLRLTKRGIDVSNYVFAELLEG